MKKLFSCANSYVRQRDWRMLAGVKFCLCSIGVLLGMQVSEKKKKTVTIGAGLVFLLTYVPLMADFLSFGWDFFRKEEEKA